MLLRTESIALHLTLDHVKRVAAQPQDLTGKTTVGRDLDAGDLLALDVVTLGVLVHQVLEGQKPGTVGLGFSEIRDILASVETAQHASLRNEFPDAVERTAVQAGLAVRLRLQADADMLNGSREGGVGETRETSSQIVLTIGEGRIGIFLLVEILQPSSGFMERTELYADLQNMSSCKQMSSESNLNLTQAPIPMSGVKVPL